MIPIRHVVSRFFTLILLLFVLSTCVFAQQKSSSKWALKNCTQSNHQGYTLIRINATGIFRDAPKLLRPGKKFVYTLKGNGEIEYKTKGNAYLKFTYISSPEQKFIFQHRNSKYVTFQPRYPESCSEDSNQNTICYVALPTGKNPSQCK